MFSEIANRKSFQRKMKTRIAAVSRPGAASGTMMPERLERRGAVDLRGLLEVPRDLTVESGQHPDREREREGQVRDDQAE